MSGGGGRRRPSEPLAESTASRFGRKLFRRFAESTRSRFAENRLRQMRVACRGIACIRSNIAGIKAVSKDFSWMYVGGKAEIILKTERRGSWPTLCHAQVTRQLRDLLSRLSFGKSEAAPAARPHTPDQFSIGGNYFVRA